jgi:Tol biopolymer transport system component
MREPLRALLTVMIVTCVLGAPVTGGAQESPDEPPAGIPPGVRWRTLETAHFRIHFYEEERALAERAAFLAERAHTHVTRYLDWLPGGRIDITLLDHTDSANGLANVLPSNYIRGFSVPPEPLSSLNDFDDWLNLLITHELTHVVHMDTIMGLPWLVDRAFGKIVAPNLVQPAWFIEGLAVLMESRLTTAGRIRSSLYDMFLRDAVMEGKLHNLAGVSNGPMVFPHGEAAYLYGSHFLKYLEDRFGPDKLTEVSHRYGRRLFPFGLNRVAREAFGARYDQLWDDWAEALRRRYALQAEAVRSRGELPATRITFDARGNRGVGSEGLMPHFFRDGRGLVYLRQNVDQSPAFVRLDPRTGARSEIYRPLGAGGASPTPDGRALVFHQVSPFPLPRRVWIWNYDDGGSNAWWHDLMLLDIESGAVRPLTRGQRAHQPDVSPDGRQVACTVGRTTGTQELALVPIEGGVPEVVVPNRRGEIAYSPAWSPDGKLIAYSRFKLGGFHDIHIYDVARKIDRPLRIDRALDIEPRFSPDGRYLLWSSDRTGIYNIFALELATDRLLQATNVLGGAFQPAVSPDGTTLVWTGFAKGGYELYTAPFAPASWPLAQPFVNERADAPPSTPAPTDPPLARETDYRAWRYLYPRSWGPPTLSRNDVGLGPALSLGITISDPASVHIIDLAGYLPTAGDPSLRAGYQYARFWPTLGVSASRFASAESDLIVDGVRQTYRRHAISVSGGINLPVLRRVDASSDLGFQYVYTDYAPANPLPIADPTSEATRPPETGPDAGFVLGWVYNNVRAWGWSVSGQEGRRLDLTLSFSDPAIGSKFRTTQIGWTWREYFTPPWARVHAFALLYHGGVGIGDKRQLYVLGGFPEQDLVRSVFYRLRLQGQYLRGYPSTGVVYGDQFHMVSAEYRAPLWRLDRGHSTFPVYLQRVHGGIYADAGNAFYGDFTLTGTRIGVGAELRLNFRLAFAVDSLLQFGVAKGLSEGGITDYYWVTSFPFY